MKNMVKEAMGEITNIETKQVKLANAMLKITTDWNNQCIAYNNTIKTLGTDAPGISYEQYKHELESRLADVVSELEKLNIELLTLSGVLM